MRRFPAVIAVVCFAACDSLAENGWRNRPEGSGASAPGERQAATAPAVVGREAAAAPLAAGPGPADPGDAAGAELRRLAAAGQTILVSGGSGEEVAAGEFVPDLVESPSAYAGGYHFGDSEWESTLELSVQGDSVSGVLGYADWENETWVGKELRLQGGRIDGARLVAPGWSGIFVRYEGRPGLVILRAPAQLGIEFGEKLGTPQG